MLEAVSHQRVEDNIQLFVDFLNLHKLSFPNINRHCYELSLFYVMTTIGFEWKMNLPKKKKKEKEAVVQHVTFCILYEGPEREIC